MDFEWVAVNLGDVSVLALAFALGFAAQWARLPPLVGYLAAGFMLATQGVATGPLIEKLSDLGITLLLFTVGLKIHLNTLSRPQVWLVGSVHMITTVAVAGACILLLATTGTGVFAGLDMPGIALLAFALCFSSTVFAVKALEARGEMNALHGQVAIGILIIQDIAAVVFLAVSSGKLPSALALLLLLLIPLRRALTALLERVGYGELMVLYGFLLALGGAEVFELVQLKGDLGALVLGVLIANHPKADELAKRMLGFKDLFLVAFFLSIGLAGGLNAETAIIGLALTPFVLLKAAGFFMLLTRFRLRARTALLAALNLANYSEFGLIVAAIGASLGLISAQWLAVIAVSLSLSFVLAALFNARSHALYVHFGPTLRRWQQAERLPDDRLLDIGDARIVIVGMGGVGTAAYDEVRRTAGDAVVGIDIDPITARNHVEAGRRVMLGDPSDADFWDRVQATHRLEQVLLALPKLRTTLSVLRRLEEIDFRGLKAALAKLPDEAAELQAHGASTVYNMYTEAGTAFAAHVEAYAGASPKTRSDTGRA
ncbi:MAG: cation:proton antiporter [Pseudomonadota bacterium]